MNLLRCIPLAIFVFTINSFDFNKTEPNKPALEVLLKVYTNQLTASQRKDINEIISKAEKKVRDLIPNLPKDIKVIPKIVD